MSCSIDGGHCLMTSPRHALCIHPRPDGGAPFLGGLGYIPQDLGLHPLCGQGVSRT